MDFTYLDYFNYYLKEFCCHITANFPDFERGLVENYRPLLEAKQYKNDLYVKCFISKVNNYMDKICSKDQTLFEPSNYVDKETGLVAGLFFLEGVDFLKLWANSFNTDENQSSIWKYLQLLSIIGRKIVPNKAEVLEILNSVGTQVHAPAKVEKTLLGTDEEDLSDAGNKPDMFGIGNIASLASGLMGLGGSGSGNGLAEIFKTVGDLCRGIDIKGLSEEFEHAQTVDEAETPTNEQQDQQGQHEQSEQQGQAEQQGQQEQQGQAGQAEQQGQAESNESNLETSTNANTGTATNLFVDMAKEMASTFDFSQMESGDQPTNMADAFKKIMSGNNPKKMAGLITKFGKKIKSEMESGKFNPTDLFDITKTNESMGMNNATGTSAEPNAASVNTNDFRKLAEKMLKGNPGLAAQAEQMRRQQQQNSQGGMTKERLRAKLEAKRQSEQSGNPQ